MDNLGRIFPERSRTDSSSSSWFGSRLTSAEELSLARLVSSVANVLVIFVIYNLLYVATIAGRSGDSGVVAQFFICSDASLGVVVGVWAVLEGFGDVPWLDSLRIIQVGNGASDFYGAHVGAGAEAEFLGSGV